MADRLALGPLAVAGRRLKFPLAWSVTVAPLTTLLVRNAAGACKTMIWFAALPSVWPPPVPPTKFAVPPLLRKRLDNVRATEPPLAAFVVTLERPVLSVTAPSVSAEEALPAPRKVRAPPARTTPATSLM